jgi:hypothetical protein
MDEDEREIRVKPTVVPINGFVLPPPPDWKLTDEAKHLGKLARGAIAPEDLTIRGKPRCVYTKRDTGIRCANEAVLGTTVCRFHGAKLNPHPDDPNPGAGGAARESRIEAVRTHLELAAQSAAMAVQFILEDEMSRPQDRLKAAEIVLDRTVGRHVQLEKENAAERDLDKEILAIAESIAPTGTEGATPESPS